MGYGNAITMPVSQVAQLQTNAGRREDIGSPSHRIRSHAISICVSRAACNGISCGTTQNGYDRMNSLTLRKVAPVGGVCIDTIFLKCVFTVYARECEK